MNESGNSYGLIDDPFVLSVEAIEAMREHSEREAVRPPSEEKQTDLMLDFLFPRKS